MKSAISSLSVLLILVLPLAVGAQGFPEESGRLDAALENVSQLEAEFGNNDPRLTESLAQLATLYRGAGRFGDAHRVIDRATQIVRVNEGLYTRSQLPFVRLKVENFADWNDWDKAREQLQHLLWLHRTKSTRINQQAIDTS